MDEIKSLRDHITEHNEKEDSAMQSILQWRWMLAGGVIVLAWIISNVKLEFLAKLLN
jgi:hypothetical protein